MHGVDLGQVTTERASCPHLDPAHGVQTCRDLIGRGDDSNIHTQVPYVGSFFVCIFNQLCVQCQSPVSGWSLHMLSWRPVEDDMLE